MRKTGSRKVVVIPFGDGDAEVHVKPGHWKVSRQAMTAARDPKTMKVDGEKYSEEFIKLCIVKLVGFGDADGRELEADSGTDLDIFFEDHVGPLDFEPLELAAFSMNAKIVSALGNSKRPSTTPRKKAAGRGSRQPTRTAKKASRKKKSRAK